NDPDLEACLTEIIDSILNKATDAKIQGILHCLNAFKTLTDLSESYNAPLISYVFSAIRKVHQYRETLYCANVSDGVFCSGQCEQRYQSFMGEESDFPLLERRELVALLGKPKTFPLIPLMHAEPANEVCICSEAYSPSPQIFIKAPYVDQDIFYECKNLFPEDRIINRQHPYKLDQLKINRSEVKHDPAATILSCKRVASVSSQIVLKAMLWNRTVVMKKNTLPLSFACEKEMDSCRTVDLAFLNYYLFCYLVPSELMFDDAYWRWRLTSPAESAIYKRHIEYYLEKFSISSAVFEGTDPDERFQLFLRGRHCDEHTISKLLSTEKPDSFCYQNAVSKIKLEFPDSAHEQWCLNTFDGSEYISHFSFDLDQKPTSIYFFPLEDKAGFISLKKVTVHRDSRPVESKLSGEAPYRFLKQKNGHLLLHSRLGVGRVDLALTWTYRDIHSHVQETEFS
ncbi:MAG: hypothetical protein ACLFU4_07970, partial [Opitutales bacterium]